MFIYCCPKCKYTDLGNEGEEKRCMRCHTPMVSLGLSSAQWNLLTIHQMNDTVDRCVAENRVAEPEQIAPDLPERYEPEVPKEVPKTEPKVEPKETVRPAAEPFVAPQRKRVAVPVDNTIRQRESSSSQVADTADNEGKNTPLAIVSIIVSFLGCLSVVGIILGIIDLILGVVKKDGRKKILPIFAIAIGAVMIVLSTVIVTPSLTAYLDKARAAQAVQEEMITTPAPEPEPAETPAVEEEEATEEEPEEEQPEQEAEEETSVSEEEESAEETEEEAPAEDTEEEEPAEEAEEEAAEDAGEAEEEPEDSTEEEQLPEEELQPEDVEPEEQGDDVPEEETAPPEEEDDDQGGPDNSGLSDSEFCDKYANDFILGTSMALDGYISKYKLPLAPKKWTLARFDDTNTMVGETEIKYNNQTGTFRIVGKLLFDGEKVRAVKPHYILVLDEVLVDDGYSDDFNAAINNLF